MADAEVQPPMISHVALATVWVMDQDTAKAFYVDTLGFEEQADVTTEDGLRWLTVSHPAQPGLHLTLLRPGPPLDQEDAAAITRMLAKGSLGAIALGTPDCRAAYEALTARGVEFAQPPEERSYGVEAILRDPSGSSLVLVERHGSRAAG